MNNPDDGHIFKRFDDEMAHLHNLVVEMGNLALRQLRESVQTLVNEDPETAKSVIERDALLNDLDIKADLEITRIIAKRQPMAKDLREIIAVGKIVAELERAGDEARKIAGLTVRFLDSGSTPPPPNILEYIVSLSDYVGDMLAVSVDAFDNLDLDTAATVLEKGVGLEQKLQEIVSRLGDAITENHDNVRHFVDIVLGIRALERFGGHAKNIAGHIVFITDGMDVRHEGDHSILEKLKNR